MTTTITQNHIMLWEKNSKAMLMLYWIQGNYICFRVAQSKSLNLNPQIVPQSKFPQT